MDQTKVAPSRLIIGAVIGVGLICVMPVWLWSWVLLLGIPLVVILTVWRAAVISWRGTARRPRAK